MDGNSNYSAIETTFSEQTQYLVVFFGLRYIKITCTSGCKGSVSKVISTTLKPLSTGSVNNRPLLVQTCNE